ncbi:oxidoreductase, zinc-binding dehydrogenase family [Verrucomicrobiia bacterium DG1235]|nr:oxidoreductase, zinc-binding dehydrogenase family [Verrucomicrobiae bacterium DG1235]
MKALVLEEYGRFEYKEVARPEIGPKEVLVKVEVCGICGSDVHGMDGSTGRRIPPIIMGHEASGEIVEVGAEVESWSIGNRVTFDSTVYRLDDWYTKRGLYNLSDKREVLGVSPGDFRRHGAFAEFVSIPEHILHTIPDSVTYEQAAMVEPIAVALHALRLAEVDPSQRCVVVGVGMIGVFVLQALRALGVETVYAVDLNSRNRERAMKQGAAEAFDPAEEGLVERIQGMTEGRGVDLAIEAVGIEPTVNLAVDLLRKGGTAVLVGNLAPDVSFPLQKVVTRQLRIQGSCAICGEYPDALELIEKGKIRVDEHIAAVAPLSEGAAWFEKLKNNLVSGKVILKP